MDIVTPQRKPVLASLSTIYSTKTGSANSRATFSLLTPISTVTDQEYGMAAVIGMSGTHTIVNLPNPVEIQIKSTWFNGIENATESAITGVTIPRGNYDYSKMLAFLNTNLPTFSDSPYEDTVYGLGGVPFVTTQPQNSPVSKDPVNTKLIFTQWAEILTQVIPGTINEHQYRTFEIVNTQEVYRLFILLGLVAIQNPSLPYAEGPNFIIRCNVSSQTYDAISDTTTFTYNVQNEILAPYSFDFSGIKSLYLYIESPVNSQFRSPFENNSQSNLLCRVPINVIFGEQFTYLPSLTVYSEQRNLVVSNLAVSCRDDFGQFVDFENVPWFLDIEFKFAIKDESEPSISGTNGVPATISQGPTLHSTARSYNNGPSRDLLYSSSQKNTNTQSNKKRKQFGADV
jgi:hypothetical protein